MDVWRWICARIYMSCFSNSRLQHRQVLPNSLGRRRSLSEDRVGGPLARDDEATRPATKFVGHFEPQVPPGDTVSRQNSSSSSKSSSLSISSVTVTSSSPTNSPSAAQQSLPWYTDYAEAHAAVARHFSSASSSFSSVAARSCPTLDDSYPSLDDFYPKPSGSGALTHVGACGTRERTGGGAVCGEEAPRTVGWNNNFSKADYKLQGRDDTPHASGLLALFRMCSLYRRCFLCRMCSLYGHKQAMTTHRMRQVC